MTNPKVKFKRSSIEGKVPTVSDLPLGEIAINTFDGRVYTARSTDSGVTTSIVNLSGINVQNSSTPVGFANTLNFTGNAITGIAFTVGIATITISTSGTPSLKTISSFICTEGQTGFSTTYTAGYIDVFLNGVRLSESEFLASDGNNITLDVGASLNDVVDIIKYEPDLSGSNWTLTGTDIYRYSKVGINTIPTVDLDVVGDVLVSGVTTSATVNANTTLQIGGVSVTSTAAELNILDGVTATTAELNILDGVTATTAELNILDGVTATTAELNILDGVTATTAELNILDGVTATTAELNILDGVTATTAELNLVNGSAAGTIVNSKAVIYGAAGQVNATTLQIGGVSVTSTAAELNILDGVTATTAELNILDGVTSTAAELNLLDTAVAGTVVNSKAVIYGAAGQVSATQFIRSGGTASQILMADGSVDSFPVSGDWWGDKIPQIGSNGVMEIGRYIDFHSTDATTSDFTFRFDNSSDGNMSFQGNLSVNGNITASGTVTATSDERLKENIEVIPNALEKVSKIRGVTFTRNDQEDKEKKHVGVIAQEVEKALPEVVMEGSDGIKSVAYGNLVGLLIEAIKEQQKQINELKEEINILKGN